MGVLLDPDGQETARENDGLNEVDREGLVLQRPELLPRCTGFVVAVRIVKMGSCGRKAYAGL